MYEMIGYIFGSLKSSEDSIKNIKRAIRAQRAVNQGIAIFAWSAVAYMLVELHHDQKQNEKIEKLSQEVKELKRMKGN